MSPAAPPAHRRRRVQMGAHRLEAGVVEEEAAKRGGEGEGPQGAAPAAKKPKRQ